MSSLIQHLRLHNTWSFLHYSTPRQDIPHYHNTHSRHRITPHHITPPHAVAQHPLCISVTPSPHQTRPHNSLSHYVTPFHTITPLMQLGHTIITPHQTRPHNSLSHHTITLPYAHSSLHHHTTPPNTNTTHNTAHFISRHTKVTPSFCRVVVTAGINFAVPRYSVYRIL